MLRPEGPLGYIDTLILKMGKPGQGGLSLFSYSESTAELVVTDLTSYVEGSFDRGEKA